MTLNTEERAYRSIMHLILSGHYRPGDFLLEQEIAEKLGMSRTPVSRALARLVVEGFLEKMPKKGCFIPLPTPEDAENVFFARKAVESQAAAAASVNARKEEIEHLEKIIQDDIVAVSKHSKEDYAQINEEFHLGVAKASHNPYLLKWVQNIFWRSNVYVFYFDSFYKLPQQSTPQKTPSQHYAIMQAIARRDSAAAAREMEKHIAHTYRVLLLGQSD